MTQQETLDYNKRCAEFLGSELKNDGQFDYWTYDHLGFDSIKISGSAWVSGNFKFHSDWNWIMEVVEAIEDIIFDEDNSFNVTIGSTNYCVIQDSNGEVFETIQDYGDSKKETVVQAINQFLIWYEQNK
jgi:hypothetical protein